MDTRRISCHHVEPITKTESGVELALVGRNQNGTKQCFKVALSPAMLDYLKERIKEHDEREAIIEDANQTYIRFSIKYTQ